MEDNEVPKMAKVSACLWMVINFAMSVASATNFFEEGQLHNFDIFAPSLWTAESGIKRDTLPKPLRTLTTEAAMGSNYDYGADCQLTITSEENTVLEATDAKCPTKPSLRMILESLMPDISLDTASSSFICTDCYVFRSMAYAKTNKTIRFVAAAKTKINTMNPAYFKLANAILSVSFDSENFDVSLADLDIELTGDHSLKGHTAKMTILKPKGRKAFTFDLKINYVLLRDLLAMYSIHMEEMVEPDSGIIPGPFVEVSFENPTIKGVFSIAEGGNGPNTATLQMVGSGKAFRIATIYVVINKDGGLDPKAAIIAGIPSAEKSNALTMVKKFLSYQEFIPDLVMVRKFKDKYLIALSQADMVIVKEESFVKFMAPYMNIYDTHQIVKGLSIQVKVPLKKNLKECSNEKLETNEEQKDVLISMVIDITGVKYRYPDNFKYDLEKMLGCLDPTIASKLPTQLFAKTGKVMQFKDVAISPTRMSVSAVVNGPIKLGGGLIVIKYIHLEADRVKRPPEPWKFGGYAPVTIGPKPIKAHALIQKIDKTYALTVKIESLMLEDITTISGNNEALKFLQNFGPLKKFGIKKLRIMAKFGEEKLVRITGKPLLFGLENLYLEANIFKVGIEEPRKEDANKEPQKLTTEGGGDGGDGGGDDRRAYRRSFKNAVSIGILLSEVKLTKLLEAICGRPVLTQGWLSKVTAYLIYSTDDTDKKFTLTELRDVEVKRGLTLYARMRIPDDCKGNKLCEILREVGGPGVSLFIRGRIGKQGNTWQFELSAGVKGEKALIPERLILTELMLTILVKGKDSKIELGCGMNYKKDDLQLRFKGTISLSVTGKLSFSFTMAGMIMQPFGIKYLAIGDALLSMGIQIPGPISSLEMGAALWIGKIDPDQNKNDHAIKINCYFGIDVANPTNNYIYAQINRLTIGSIFKAFKYGVKLPKFLEDTGFPDGLFLTFTSNPAGKQLKGLSTLRFIAPGLFLKGTLNILGLTVKANIVLSKKVTKIDIEMSPLTFAGNMISIRRSETEKNKGPKFYVLINPETVTANITGYVNLMGMSRAISIYVSDTGYEFDMTSNLFGIVETELYVKANYGTISAASFSFRGKLKVSFVKLAEEIKNFLAATRQVCERALERGRQTLQRAREKVQGAKSKIDNWKGSLSRFRERNNRRIRELEERKRQMNQNCKRDCGQICIGFLKWRSHCRKFLWWWVGCLYWDSCAFRAPNIPCIIKCEATRFFNKLGASIQQFGLRLVNAVSRLGDFVLDIGKDIINIGDKVLALADSILVGVKAIVSVGLSIVSSITTFLLEKLLVIHNLEVFGSFNENLNACIGIDCDITLLGTRIAFKGEICINPNFFKGLASSLSNKKYPEVDKVDRKLQEKEGSYRELQSDENVMQNEINKGETKVNNEMRNARKRSEIPSAEERENMEYNPFPEWVMKRTEIMDIISTSSPWALADKIEPENLFINPVIGNASTADKRTLRFKNSNNRCSHLKNVVARYDELAQGLLDTCTEIKIGEKMFQAYDESFAEDVNDVKRTVDKIESTYNLTRAEKEDAYFWYNTFKDGYEQWRMKFNNLLRFHRSNAVPRFREHVYYIVKKSFDQDTGAYLRSLKDTANKALKGSVLTNPKRNVQEQLDKIGKILTKAFVHQGKSHHWIFRHVKKAKEAIITLRKSLDSCKSEVELD